ncbi:origin recognition complex subunit 5 [Phlebotomus argentipes]|uniref:origin recognition complex subunit 5 n=1 Tax=Phlebotomus argentipes TaxID=94469 RepID=UPI0028937E37|nr:origin recognition complex subunit 5 [Phlebotomus argentipes]
MQYKRLLPKITSQYPCREDLVENLYDLLGYSDEILPEAIYICGPPCSGKTVIISTLLRYLKNIRYAIVDCLECYSSKLLFEDIFDSLCCHELSYENSFTPRVKCENMRSFISELRREFADDSLIIVLKNAEKLRDMDMNILPSFVRLRELTGINVCCIFVGQIPFEKLLPKTGLPTIIRIRVSQYSKEQTETILLKEFTRMQNALKEKMRNEPEISKEEFLRRLEIISSFDMNFYRNYLNAFLHMFYRVCRNLIQLRMVAEECFDKYCEPVFHDPSAAGNVNMLWRNISSTLKDSLKTLYTRLNATSIENSEKREMKDFIQIVELPFYAKYLLIAGYLASHNPAKEDKRLFVKDHGKQKKRLKSVNAKAKVSEKTMLLQGPATFSVDRLLAIFHAIIDQKVCLTCDLLAQISTLVELGFFTRTTTDKNLLEGSARFVCGLQVSVIMRIGEMVGFSVSRYLCDLM